MVKVIIQMGKDFEMDIEPTDTIWRIKERREERGHPACAAAVRFAAPGSCCCSSWDRALTLLLQVDS